MARTKILKRKYGWKPDVPDSRDFIFKSKKLRLFLPKQVDLREKLSPVEDQGSVGSCHDDKTEVLTNVGWILFKFLRGNELLASVDPISHSLIFEKPRRLISYEYLGQMICADNQSLNFCVTPDHKMLVRKWNESIRELDKKYSFVDAKDLGWYSGLINRIKFEGFGGSEAYIIPGVKHKQKPQRLSKSVSMSVWLKFLGYYLADGTLCPGKNQYKVQLAASTERKKIFVRELLKMLEIKFCELPDRITFENKQIFTELVHYGLLGIHAPFKFVPPFVFIQKAELINDFLYGHAQGDGHTNTWGLKSHYTSSIKLANDLQTLIFLSGNEARIFVRAARTSLLKDGRIIVGKFPEYRVSVCEKKNLSIERAENIFTIQYNGKVYCAEMTTYHTLVTRRNNKILISGNCTGNALAGNIEFLLRKNNDTTDVSRLFIYYNERLLENTVNQDAGAYLRNGIKTLAKHGVCAESLWPYIPKQYSYEPTAECYEDAKKRKIALYERLISVSDIFSCLAEGYPVVCGIAIYENFESNYTAATGMVGMPQPGEVMLGGHAVMVCGYDLLNKTFIVRNSWGSSWGVQGYFRLPFEYVEKLGDDFWTIRAMA
jgi:hypothetical protein